MSGRQPPAEELMNSMRLDVYAGPTCLPLPGRGAIYFAGDSTGFRNKALDEYFINATFHRCRDNDHFRYLCKVAKEGKLCGFIRLGSRNNRLW